MFSPAPHGARLGAASQFSPASSPGDPSAIAQSLTAVGRSARSTGRTQVGANRVAFADQLRGLAALLVVLSHLAGVFWHAQPAVSALTGLPAAFADPPRGTGFLKPLFLDNFQAGPAGVALFFLISGYVIPFSLRGRSRAAFLGARAVRLLPTFWAGFAVQVAVLLLALRTVGGVFPRTLPEVLLNLLPGIHGLAWLPSLDGIVWTLDIEVYFYALAALAAPMLLARSSRILVLPAGVALVGASLSIDTSWITIASPPVMRCLTGLAMAAPLLVFMSVGTVMHLAEADARWRRRAFILVPAMLAVFAALRHWWPHGSLGRRRRPIS
jgi:peptidoglycan/LPS O-acetylase OafA/YrhL